jgi:hypothetical protein
VAGSGFAMRNPRRVTDPSRFPPRALFRPFGYGLGTWWGVGRRPRALPTPPQDARAFRSHATPRSRRRLVALSAMARNVWVASSGARA